MVCSQKEALQYIAENDVKFIKLFFTDIFGTIKSISIQPSELERAFATGVSFDASGCAGFLRESERDLFIVPDSSTLSVLPWRPQHGRVVRFFCFIRRLDGSPFEGDSRKILIDVESKIKSSGYGALVGTECEFYLSTLDENGNPTGVPHDRAGYCDLAPLDKGENARRDICLTLEQMGIQPESSRHERGPGQHEVAFKCAPPSRAADNVQTFKTVVRSVAARNGLCASFLPKPLDGEAGSGMRVNVSLEKDGAGIFEREELPPQALQFIAGILRRVNEITLFLNPLDSSYKRLGNGRAPSRADWSRGNSSALVRVPAEIPARRRIELRSPDASCNPYLAIALTLSAGMEGISCALEPPPEIAGGSPALPASRAEAVRAALSSDFARSVLPASVIEAYAQDERENSEGPR